MSSRSKQKIWRVRLVHTELGSRVVEASCEQEGQLLAVAFGEATTTEVAEDRARRRVGQLLADTGHALAASVAEPDEPSGAEAPEAPMEPSSPAQPYSPPPPAVVTHGVVTHVEPPAPAGIGDHRVSEPSDWSEDLALVELQLQRLGWDQNQESVYLERCFGFLERNHITRHQDLQTYIDLLTKLPPQADPCTAPLQEDQDQQPLPQHQPMETRQQLMENGNGLLGQLGWTTSQGRALLERHFGHSSRQFLRDEQLMQFNQQLESLLLTGGAHHTTATP